MELTRRTEKIIRREALYFHNSSNIMTRKWRMRCVKHAARIGDMRNAYKF
jgi:hypothetical protein